MTKLNEDIAFMINEIRNKGGLKNKIEGIKNKNENNKLKKNIIYILNLKAPFLKLRMTMIE